MPRVIERELADEAVVVALLAADGDGVSVSLGDLSAREGAVDLENTPVEGVLGGAVLGLITAVGHVDRAVVGDVESLRPVELRDVDLDVDDDLAGLEAHAISRLVRDAANAGGVLVIEEALVEEQTLRGGELAK